MHTDPHRTLLEPAVPAADAAPAFALHPDAPGWYREPGTPGVLQYWNGLRWEDWHKPDGGTPAADRNPRDLGIAYLLVAFLGALGVHDFYLGRTAQGVAKLLMWFIGFLLGFTGFGFLLLAGATAWAIVDLFRIRGYVQTANAGTAAR